MLATDKGSDIATVIPPDRLLTETDGLFTFTNDRPARPTDVALLIERLAVLRATSPDKLAETVLPNLRTLLDRTSDRAFSPSCKGLESV